MFSYISPFLKTCQFKPNCYNTPGSFNFEVNMAVKASSYQLNICCKKHPNCRGIRKPKNCDSCALLYVLLHQHAKDGPDKLGNLNPYAYFLNVDLQQACEGLLVKPELAPSKLEFTNKKQVPERMHYPGCPEYPSNRERVKGTVMDIGCTCAQAARE